MQPRYDRRDGLDWLPVEDDDTHLMHAETALVSCGIRYRQVGGQGSQGRHWGTPPNEYSEFGSPDPSSDPANSAFP